MYSFGDEHPELTALFQALQDGIQGVADMPKTYPLLCAMNTGAWVRTIAREEDAARTDIAAGLRMVADTIDPPAMVEARREIAETLGPSMLTPDEWEARLTARNMEREKLGPQGGPPHTWG